MIKKQQKVLGIAVFCLAFLFVLFFSLGTHEASAADLSLEVQYPVISGQTLGANTKLPAYVLYLFNAGMFLGFFAVFLSLIIAGVMYFLSPVKADLLTAAKDRISGAISGLLILVLTYLIVTTINPQLSILSLNELPPAPQPPAETKAPGVYLYPQSDCSNERIQANTTDIADLGDLKGHVNSVGIVQNANTRTYYIPILYNNVGLWGKCQYINPNSACTKVDHFASSASIHLYDFNPNGDGVYFYRKSYFNGGGGYYKVKNPQINNIYVGKLDDLKFNNVPEEEQDCLKYNQKGDCAERTPPSLGGENISSVKINGNYIVLLTYAPPGQDCNYSPWDFCQEFPTAGDVNKLGPQQVKWENIRNNEGIIPNCVIIIPVQQK